jgi:hypothetical protein
MIFAEKSIYMSFQSPLLPRYNRRPYLSHSIFERLSLLTDQIS